MVTDALPTRVLVTGAAGMLGSHLVTRLLAEGVLVNGFDRASMEPADGLTVHRGDIRDREAIVAAATGCDAVVHCAAALPSYSTEQINSIIVDGTSTVLRGAADAEVPRLVHISSTAVYGLPKIVPTPETHPREPVDPYSTAKARAEEAAEALRAEGHCVGILRPKTFVGPGRMGLFAMLFEWAEEGRGFPVLGRGDVRIQMLAIDDLVDGVLAMLSAPTEVAGDTYNLAADRFGTIRQDFQAVLDAAGHGKRVKSIPAGPAVALLGLLQAAKLSPVYGRLLHKLKADSFVDTTKANQSLGFSPQHSNQDAVVSTYRWWQANRVQSPNPSGGRTSRDPWKQGVLGLAKVFF